MSRSFPYLITTVTRAWQPGHSHCQGEEEGAAWETFRRIGGCILWEKSLIGIRGCIPWHWLRFTGISNPWPCVVKAPLKRIICFIYTQCDIYLSQTNRVCYIFHKPTWSALTNSVGRDFLCPSEKPTPCYVTGHVKVDFWGVLFDRF